MELIAFIKLEFIKSLFLLLHFLVENGHLQGQGFWCLVHHLQGFLKPFAAVQIGVSHFLRRLMSVPLEGLGKAAVLDLGVQEVLV